MMRIWKIENVQFDLDHTTHREAHFEAHKPGLEKLYMPVRMLYKFCLELPDSVSLLTGREVIFCFAALAPANVALMRGSDHCRKYARDLEGSHLTIELVIRVAIVRLRAADADAEGAPSEEA